MKKRAFTLAELLISMAIIGILSALLVPVMTNWQKKSLETQTVHFYALMSNAIKQYMVDNDTTTLISTPIVEKWFYNHDNPRGDAVKAVDDFVNSYFNVRKSCTFDNQYECFPETISSVDEQTAKYEMLEYDSKAYVLANGVVFTMRPFSLGDNGWARGAEVQFDVNGRKGPNTAGRDIWYFSIFRDGTITDTLLSTWDGELKRYYADHPEDLERDKKDFYEYRSKRCTGESEENRWWTTEYAGGCFARFEANGFKFDY